MSDPLRMFLVLRRGAVGTLERAAVLGGAAAVACVRSFPIEPEWRERPGKVCLRARNPAQWEAVLAEPHALAGDPDGESVAALPPRRRSDRGPLLERLQAMSTDLGPAPAELEGGHDGVTYALNPELDMSSGKVVAQVAHAAVMAAEALPGWAEAGAPGRLVAPRDFAALSERGDLAARVVDAGLTEVAPGTITVLALPPSLPGDVKAHLAVPPVGDGPWPGVVVLHESFGLNADIRQQAHRLATAGYLALAPDLYSAGGYWRCVRATFRALSAGRGKAFDDIEAARTWLGERPDCTGRVGVLGFCMGGGFALATAARGFDVSAPNYAHLPKDLDGALKGACPVVASYGAKDRMLPRTAAKLEAALERAGVEHDVREYPEAGHSFLNRHDFGPGGALLRVAGVGFHGPSAEDAWGRILRFFEAHLRG